MLSFLAALSCLLRLLSSLAMDANLSLGFIITPMLAKVFWRVLMNRSRSSASPKINSISLFARDTLLRIAGGAVREGGVSGGGDRRLRVLRRAAGLAGCC